MQGLPYHIPADVQKVNGLNYMLPCREQETCNTCVNHCRVLQKRRCLGSVALFSVPLAVSAYSPFVTHFLKHFPLPLAPLVHTHGSENVIQFPEGIVLSVDNGSTSWY